MKLLERDIQKQITDWLSHRRIFWYRNNTGAMYGEHKGKRWAVRFGVRGAPDIVCVIKGQYIGIEVKRPGEKLTEAQMNFAESLQLSGGLHTVASCVEDIQFLEEMK